MNGANMNKRWLFSFGLIGAIVFGCTTGCAPKEEDGISFALGGAPGEIAFWEELIGEFETESGIKVNLIRQPTDTDQRRQGLLISLKAKRKDPDLFLMDVAWIAQFAASGWLKPLDGYLARSSVTSRIFFQQLLNETDKYKNQFIALPVYVDAGLLYYRKDLLAKYGIASPPKTWDELLNQSIRVQNEMRKTNPNFYAFVWQGAQYEGLICNFLEFAASGGGSINGDTPLNSPENNKAVSFMRDLIHKHKVSPVNTFTEMKEEETRMFFQQGNALFERNWPYAWALHQADNSKVKGKVGIAPLPAFAGGQSVSTLGGWHVGISAFSDNPNDAWKLIEFILSHDVQKRVALKLGWNPGRKDVYEDAELLKELPHFKELRAVFENALPRPLLPYYNQISEVLQQSINGILSGEVAPEAGLASAQKKIAKIHIRYRGVKS